MRSNCLQTPGIEDREMLDQALQAGLDDPQRHWKISAADYSERELWSDSIEALEEAMEEPSTKPAPWYVIPSNHKWVRNLAIAEIVPEHTGGHET